MKWTQDYNIHIITVIHSIGTYGHLGSFLEKKTETQITVTPTEDNPDVVSLIVKEVEDIHLSFRG